MKFEDSRNIKMMRISDIKHGQLFFYENHAGEIVLAQALIPEETSSCNVNIEAVSYHPGGVYYTALGDGKVFKAHPALLVSPVDSSCKVTISNG